MSDLDKFVEDRVKIPIPDGDVLWVKLLAKELVLGVYRKLWSSTIQTGRSDTVSGEVTPRDRELANYFEKRWRDHHSWEDHHIGHHLQLLRGHGYIHNNGPRKGYTLTKAAFDLIDEAEPYNVFISYKRSESSALALLVLARLKAHGPVPFMDMMLEPGENWHADLKERIKKCDYFIILLGEKTLASTMTIKEIEWAIKYRKTIIPVWHSGFDLDSEQWKDVDSKVKEAIQRTNAIRVIEESASDYNRAIVELLNRFGITP